MPLLSINVFIFVIIYKLPTSMNISIDVCVSVLGSECVAQYVYSYLFVYIRTHSFSILYSRYVSMSVSFVSLSLTCPFLRAERGQSTRDQLLQLLSVPTAFAVVSFILSSTHFGHSNFGL
jgi:hypothetical protein